MTIKIPGFTKASCSFSTESFINRKTMAKFDRPWLIAGGALRDSYLEKDVKDIDVFVPVGDSLLLEMKRQKKIYLRSSIDKKHLTGIALLEGKDTIPLKTKEGENPYEVLDAEFACFADKQFEGLDFIAKASEYWASDCTDESCKGFAEELFSYFPCSLSRIAYNPVINNWWIHESFYESVRNRIITFNECAPSAYIDRIMTKYCHWAWSYE